MTYKTACLRSSRLKQKAEKEWLLGYSDSGLLALGGATNLVTAELLPENSRYKKNKQKNVSVEAESKSPPQRKKAQNIKQPKKKTKTKPVVSKQRIESKPSQTKRSPKRHRNSPVKSSDSVRVQSQVIKPVASPVQLPASISYQENAVANNRLALVNAIQSVNFLAPGQKQALLQKLLMKQPLQQESLLQKSVMEFLYVEQARFQAAHGLQMHQGQRII